MTCKVIAGLMMICACVQAQTIRDIRVESEAGPLEAGTVKAYIGSREGMAFSADQVSKDTVSLKESGRFSQVKVSVEPLEGEEVNLVYQVSLRERIRKIYVRGNDYLSDGRIRKELGLERGDLVDDAIMQVALERLREKYKKEYFTQPQFDYEFKSLANPAFVELYVNVEEGPRAKVDEIVFTGLEGLRAKDLQKKMRQKEFWLLSYITGSGRYEPDVLDRDLLNIRTYCRSLGFLDARLKEPLIEEKKPGKLTITVPVEEGEQYLIGDITFEGLSTYTEEEVRAFIGIQTGDVASTETIQKAAGRVQDYYALNGFYLTRVRPAYLPNMRKEKVVDIVFKVREGTLSTVRDVEIRGNRYTRDKVIRRELSILPGEVLDEVKLRGGANRLRGTQFFSYVNYSVIPTAKKDVYDVVYEVEEQRTGQLGAGVGFSSIEELTGFLELSQSNFDLGKLIAGKGALGAGQKLRLRTTLGTKSRNILGSFEEPYFLDRKLRFSLSGYQRDSRFLSDDYDQRNTGGEVALSKPLAPFWRGRLGYSLESIDVYNLGTNVSELIRVEEGESLSSTLALTLTRDARNQFWLATEGSRVQLRGALTGGPLGLDVDIYDLSINTSTYFPLFFGHYLNIRTQAATVEEYDNSDRVPIFDRKFLGGARTIRGFKFREVGPKDEQGEPIGGNSMLYATAEYNIPLVSLLRAAVFYDAGVVNEESYDFEVEDYNSSYGIGIRLDQRGFPLQLDYSWPLETDEFNDRSSGLFSINIGYTY